MQLRADYVVGSQSQNSWSGVYGFKPDGSIEPLELFAIIRVASTSKEERLEALAKMFLDEVQHYLFTEGKEGDYIVRLENAVWKMKSKMEFLLASDERYSQNGLDIEIALALFDRNFLYLGVIGESKIYIQRGDRFVDLSRGLTDANMMGFLRSGSMELEPGDRLALATSLSASNGFSNIESAISQLNIKQIDAISKLEGVAVLLLGEEKDLWFKEEIVAKPEVIEEEVPEIVEEFEDNSSAKYIPIQEEDFSEDTGDLTNQELNDVSAQNQEVEPLQMNPRLENQVRAKKVASHVQTLFQKGLEIGKSHAKKINNSIQDLKARRSSSEYTEVEESDIEVAPSALRSNLQKNLQNKVLPFLQNSNKTYIKYARDIATRLFNGIKAFLSWFKKEFIGGGIDDRKNIFAKAKRRRRNRIILVVGVVLLVIFTVNGINNRNAELAEQSRVQGIESRVNSYKSQLDQLVKESAGSLDDAEKASLISELDTLRTNLEAQKRDGLFLESINSQQDTIAKTKDLITGTVPFTQVQVIADLGKTYSNAELEDIEFTKGNLYVSDNERGVIYQIGTSINSNVNQIATDLNGPSTLAVNVAGDLIFYDSSNTSSIARLNVDSGEVTRLPGLPTAVIGNITNAYIFTGNDALYEIHQNHQQIFKRDKNGDTYVGGGAVYNTQNPPNWRTDPEFGSAIDIDIPFEIYVLIRGKGVKRYLAGGENTINQNTFINTSKSDFDSLSNATAIDIDGKILAVADPTNRRVIIFSIQDNDTRNLVFEKSIVYRGNDSNVFKNIKELVVNESSRNVFVLDGTSIIRLDL